MSKSSCSIRALSSNKLVSSRATACSPSVMGSSLARSSLRTCCEVAVAASRPVASSISRLLAGSSKNKVLAMHKFRKHGGQEPPRKLFEVCDLTYLTTGGLRFDKNAETSRMEGPQDFKCDLCDYTASKIMPLVNTESESMVFFFAILFQKHCFRVKCASFHVLKKTLLLSICRET